jgi:hypothetical protein
MKDIICVWQLRLIRRGLNLSPRAGRGTFSSPDSNFEIAELKRFPPDLNQGIPRWSVMGDCLGIDSLMGGDGPCRRPIRVICGRVLSRL